MIQLKKVFTAFNRQNGKHNEKTDFYCLYMYYLQYDILAAGKRKESEI